MSSAVVAEGAAANDADDGESVWSGSAEDADILSDTYN